MKLIIVLTILGLSLISANRFTASVNLPSSSFDDSSASAQFNSMVNNGAYFSISSINKLNALLSSINNFNLSGSNFHLKLDLNNYGYSSTDVSTIRSIIAKATGLFSKNAGGASSFHFININFNAYDLYNILYPFQNLNVKNLDSKIDGKVFGDNIPRQLYLVKRSSKSFKVDVRAYENSFTTFAALFLFSTNECPTVISNHGTLDEGFKYLAWIGNIQVNGTFNIILPQNYDLGNNAGLYANQINNLVSNLTQERQRNGVYDPSTSNLIVNFSIEGGAVFYSVTIN